MAIFGAETGLSHVSMRKTTSGLSGSMRSHASMACLPSERVFRSVHASWECDDCEVCGVMEGE